jgi:hypothetical protein
VHRWREWYGIDFSPLLASGAGGAELDLVNPWEAREWTALGPAGILRDYDLGTARGPAGAPVTLTIERRGRLDAVLLHVELRSADRTFLSTAADQVDPANHWTSPVRYLRRPPMVHEGSEVRVAYCPHPPSGTASCRIRTRDAHGRWSLRA